MGIGLLSKIQEIPVTFTCVADELILLEIRTRNQIVQFAVTDKPGPVLKVVADIVDI